MGRSKLLLVSQLFLNGSNIILDLTLAGALSMGVKGIALGTLIAEWATVIFVGRILYQELNVSRINEQDFLKGLFEMDAFKKMLSSNINILVRTLLLIFSFAFFTNQSAKFGEVTLAANYLLLQLVSFSAFFLDGYAFVVEGLVGYARGRKDLSYFDRAVKRTTILAGLTSSALSLFLIVFGDQIILLLTDIQAVRDQSSVMLWLACIYVLFAFAAFQLDGVFIGVSDSRSMRNAAILSTGFFLFFWWLSKGLEAKGLWLSMIAYVVMRAITLLSFYGSVRNEIGSSS
jgi:MATE family multidrug resistance protein